MKGEKALMEIIGWLVALALAIFIVVQLCGVATDIFGILFKVISDKKHKS